VAPSMSGMKRWLRKPSLGLPVLLLLLGNNHCGPEVSVLESPPDDGRPVGQGGHAGLPQLSPAGSVSTAGGAGFFASRGGTGGGEPSAGGGAGGEMRTECASSSECDSDEGCCLECDGERWLCFVQASGGNGGEGGTSSDTDCFSECKAP
jgi:hypothetical protein